MLTLLVHTRRALCGGVETWVEIPPERRPSSWKNFRRPVAILKLALEGHPKAGACWEAHCTEKILLCGFEKVHGWESVFVHKDLQLFLNVYVDDFKLCGKAESIPVAWAMLRKHLDLDDPTR